MSVLGWVAVGIASVVVLYGLHRWALRLERDGYLRYLKNPARSDGAGAAALGEMQKFLEPQVRHVHEMKDQARLPKKDEEGGPPPWP